MVRLVEISDPMMHARSETKKIRDDVWKFLCAQGVMLSHSAVISEVAGLHSFLKQIGEGTSISQDDVVLSYLPLAHIFDR